MARRSDPRYRLDIGHLGDTVIVNVEEVPGNRRVGQFLGDGAEERARRFVDALRYRRLLERVVAWWGGPDHRRDVAAMGRLLDDIREALARPAGKPGKGAAG